MIKEISSFRFPGFYESLFCNSDEFIDEEYALAEEYGLDANKVYMEYQDFNKYKIDVSKKYMSLYVEAINDVLPEEITDYKDFKFEIVDDEENIVVISPKYYNYNTDHCYVDIETNEVTLKLIKDYTLNLKGVAEYIVRHFTSCDGFISFISNDFEYWKSLDILDYEENMLIALLDMLLSLSDDNIFNEITYDTYEQICKFEYTVPMIDYNGKTYELYEFIKLEHKEVA